MISNSEIEWYNEIMPELEIVFDVGCRNDNVFYDINPLLEIHAFDPNIPAVKIHGTFNNIALSNRSGVADYHHEYSSLHRRELIGDKWEWVTHNKIEVPIDTLDNYCLNKGIEKIDLLKIDTEGHDYYVLLGAKRILPTIRYIQFEEWPIMTGKIKELLSDYNIEELGGKPMNYKCIRK